MNEENASICGLPSWTALTRNETVSFINNVLLAAVNAPCAIFAFLCNLAVIVTVTQKIRRICKGKRTLVTQLWLSGFSYKFL